jgi:hypothetical protein
MLQVDISWNSVSSIGCSHIQEGINACRWLLEFKMGHNRYVVARHTSPLFLSKCHTLCSVGDDGAFAIYKAVGAHNKLR